MLTMIHKNWNFGIVVILALGIGWILVSAVPAGRATNGQITAPHQGFLAPEFTLPGIDGQQYSLSDFRGQAVIVNFWASWCPPCRAEMPDLQTVYEDFHDQGVVILAVNSTIQDSPESALEFIQDNQLTFPVLFDHQGDATAAYQVSALPTTYFIDASGVIREIVVGGPMAEALLRERISRLIAEK